MSPLVVDHGVVDDQRPARRQHLVRLAHELALRVHAPVVQDVTHHQHVRGRQRLLEHVARIERQPVG
jgi:hypothetical protein